MKMLDFKDSALFLMVIFITNVNQVTSQCTFPSSYVGSWTSGDRGLLNISESSIYNYKVFIPSADPNNPTIDYYDFNCFLKISDIRYIVKSINFNVVFGVNVYFYICFDFYEIDTEMNYYYVVTDTDPYLRDTMTGIADGQSNTQTEICTLSTIAQQTFVMLVRDNAVENNEISVACPSVLQYVYGNLTLTDSSDSDNCASAQMDGCTNKTMMNFTHDGCSKKTYSDSGDYTCLYARLVDGNTYLALWNNDQTTDESTTYRVSCLAYTTSSGIITATVTPQMCTSTTNSTQSATGLQLQMSEVIGSCEAAPTTEAPFIANLSYLWILFAVFIICLILLAIILIKKFYKPCLFRWQNRKWCKRRVPDINVTKGEKVLHKKFTATSLLTSQLKHPPYFKPKRSIQVVPILDPNWNIEELPIVPPPKIESLYNDSMEEYMRGRLPKRADGLSLYSFDSVLYRSVSPSVTSDDWSTTLSTVSTD